MHAVISQVQKKYTHIQIQTTFEFFPTFATLIEIHLEASLIEMLLYSDLHVSNKFSFNENSCEYKNIVCTLHCKAFQSKNLIRNESTKISNMMRDHIGTLRARGISLQARVHSVISARLNSRKEMASTLRRVMLRRS